MDKQILTSVLVICLIILASGAGTYAYLSDRETSVGNRFEAGTLDMVLGDRDEDFRNNITRTWTATNMKPGDIFEFRGIPNRMSLANWGDIVADHLEITCDFAVNPNNMSKYMIITRIEYYNTPDYRISLLNGSWGYYPGYMQVPPRLPVNPGDWVINDTDLDNRITFFDLKYDTLDNLPAPNGDTHFEMDVKFYEGAGNEFQGKTFNLTMIFTLNQHQSQ